MNTNHIIDDVTETTPEARSIQSHIYDLRYAGLSRVELQARTLALVLPLSDADLAELLSSNIRDIKYMTTLPYNSAPADCSPVYECIESYQTYALSTTTTPSAMPTVMIHRLVALGYAKQYLIKGTHKPGYIITADRHEPTDRLHIIKPIISVYTGPYRGLVVGVEIEVSTTDTSYIQAACDSLGIAYDIKHDSSIVPAEHEVGREIVLQASPLAFYQSKSFEQFCNSIASVSAAYDRGCGLHTHINKKALSGGFGRWCASYMQANAVWFTAFSKRRNLHYCELNGAYTKSKRYSAIRPTDATAEIRLYRGTTSYPRIRASIEMSFALVRYHRACSPGVVGPLTSFFRWLEEEDDFAYLYNYLITNNLATSINTVGTLDRRAPL